MAAFGLIGNPISHSKSPALFKAAYGMDEHKYELIEASEMEEAVSLFLNGIYRGVNVTAPFKDGVMKYVTRPDRISSLLGSANVLIKGAGFAGGKGDIYSYNTDYYGVKETVEAFLNKKDLLPVRIREHGIHNVLVVGAGGAGKAATLAMADAGFKVFLANRSAGKTLEFAALAGAEYIPLSQVAECAGQADLIIYSLSFVIEQMKEADLSQKMVFEANYAHPGFAPGSGMDTGSYISGKYWLYNQAVPAFRLFTGQNPNILAMRKIIGMG